MKQLQIQRTMACNGQWLFYCWHDCFNLLTLVIAAMMTGQCCNNIVDNVVIVDATLFKLASLMLFMLASSTLFMLANSTLFMLVSSTLFMLVNSTLFVLVSLTLFILASSTLFMLASSTLGLTRNYAARQFTCVVARLFFLSSDLFYSKYRNTLSMYLYASISNHYKRIKYIFYSSFTFPNHTNTQQYVSVLLCFYNILYTIFAIPFLNGNLSAVLAWIIFWWAFF